MSELYNRFTDTVKEAAFIRQKKKCALCGEDLHTIFATGQAKHTFGEWAEGHHVIPNVMHGPVSVDNCVVLCRACHINMHQGGRFADISIYADIKHLPMSEMIQRISKKYPHYKG